MHHWTFRRACWWFPTVFFPAHRFENRHPGLDTFQHIVFRGFNNVRPTFRYILFGRFFLNKSFVFRFSRAACGWRNSSYRVDKHLRCSRKIDHVPLSQVQTRGFRKNVEKKVGTNKGLAVVSHADIMKPTGFKYNDRIEL